MIEYTCCFLGHRKIEVTDTLKKNLYSIIESLICNEGINRFLFGSKSQFNDLCYQIVSKLKTTYPHIKRVYVRAQFPYLNESYKAHLYRIYEETYFPDSVFNAGVAAYIKRNCEMIDKSKFCIIYLINEQSSSAKTPLLSDMPTKSGTQTAYNYALIKKKKVINMFNTTNRTE